jgi:hypothetical protein
MQNSCIKVPLKLGESKKIQKIPPNNIKKKKIRWIYFFSALCDYRELHCMKAVNHPEEFNYILPGRKIKKHIFNPARISYKETGRLRFQRKVDD